MFLKILILLNILLYSTFANEIKIMTLESKVKNTNTILLEIESKNISKPKLTFEKKNINFYKNSFKENYFYALIPISYYEKIGKNKIIISYLKDNKRYFTSTKIEVIDANYESEEIKVQNSKINLSEKNKKITSFEYKEAMKIYNYNSKKVLWKEDFILPMSSKITSDFGTKRVYNNQLKSYHSGIDFKAKIGSEIIASNDGIVKLAKHRFYSGNSIIIDHGQGIYTCYFHLSNIKVKKNQKIKRGELIGLSGDTGRVTGPHLHFATRVHGILVEPNNLFSILNKLNN